MAKKLRADQPGIPEVADEMNKRVHSAAKHYAKMRDARQAAGVVEKTANNRLIDTMKEEAIETYSVGDVDVCLENLESVKVVIGGKKADKDEEGDEE